MCKYSFYIKNRSRLSSFYKGMGSLDLFGNSLWHYNSLPNMEDYEAIRNDWDVIGKDFKLIKKHK